MSAPKFFSSFLATMLVFAAALPAQQYPGYTLIAPSGSTSAQLVDTNGKTYKTWSNLTGTTGYSSYLLPNRVLLRTVRISGNAFTGGGQTGRIQKVGWDGNLIWNYQYSTSTYSMHHDVCAMPNGNVLLISYELKTAAEATAAGCDSNITIWSEKVVEIQPVGATGGNVVWEWKVWDHLCQNKYPAKPNYVPSIVNTPQLFNINRSPKKDWLHMNGIDYNAELDQIVVSSHNWNELYVIDHSTTTAQAASHSGGNAGKGGDILYRWGNPSSYGASGATNFNVIHDAHWVPNGCPNAGYLAGFNNNATSSYSAGDYINPPRQGYTYTITPGSAFGPATYAKRVLGRAKTNNMGNIQELPNGNYLMCMALTGYVFEHNANGDTLWRYTAGGNMAQAFRYSEQYVNGGTPAVTATASPQSVCADGSVQLQATLTNATGYTFSWSSNPAGFTSTQQNPTVTPTQNTTYTVSAVNGTSTLQSSVQVTVKPLPAIQEISGEANGVKLSSSTYSVAAITGVAYTWSADNGQITSQNGKNTATVKWADANSGVVRVSVVGSNGCTATASKIVELSAATLSVVPAAITARRAESSETLRITALSNWTASENYDWMALSKTSGAGGFDSLIVTLSENATISERNGVITFTSGAETQTVSVVQKPTIVIGATLDTVYVSAATPVYQVVITSNGAWQATSNQVWLQISPDNGGSGAVNVMLRIAQNTGSQRVAVASFTTEDSKKEVVVIQNAASGSKRKVRFTVDMRNETVNPTGVHVTGDFQEKAGLQGGDWQPNTLPLKQLGTSSYYSAVVELPVNAKYEYKFLNGDQFYDSEFVPEETRVGYENNDNRWFWADSTLGDTIYVGPLLYAGNAPFGQKAVRFKVDMKNAQLVAATGVHVAGTFQDAQHQWDAGRTMMYSFGGTTYEIIGYADSGSAVEYKFYNGNVSTTTESVPASCAVNGNRSITLNADMTPDAVCFSSCAACTTSGTEDAYMIGGLRVYPVPFNDAFTVELPEGEYSLTVADALGRVVYSGVSLQGRVGVVLPQTAGGVFMVRAINRKTGDVATTAILRN